MWVYKGMELRFIGVNVNIMVINYYSYNGYGLLFNDLWVYMSLWVNINQGQGGYMDQGLIKIGRLRCLWGYIV